MDTTRIKLEDIQRGSLLQVANGFVIAEGIAHTWDDDARPYMRDTDLRRHFPDDDGCLTVGVAGFRTQSYGKVTGKTAKGHILLNPVPGKPPAGYCPASRNLGNRLAVWSSGTALTGVTCTVCRGMVRLVNTGTPRLSNGI